jgi:hypothetical protein
VKHNTQFEWTSLKSNAYIDDCVSIEKPHDSRFGIAGDSAAKSCTVTLLNNLGFRLGHETRLEPFCLVLDQFRGSLPSGFHLTDAFDTGHALGQLRLVDDSGFSGCLQDSAGFVHAVQVGGAADVLARVLGIDPAEVHGNVAEIEDGSETIL